ncbi:MAG: HIRAN domain-containing protein [Massilistercora timonensis]
MDYLTKEEKSGLVSLLHGKNGEVSMPKPFERDIFLFDTYVAGTSHVEGIEELEPHLQIGDRLAFFREPENPYDAQAIVIKTTDSVKIGYVPRQDNVIFARLMDAGKLLFGKITEKEKKGKWVRISIDIFLHE